MGALALRALVTFILCGATDAQFGNLEVKWEGSATASGGRPRVTDPSVRHWKPPEDIRRTSLVDLSIDALADIVRGLGARCDSCATQGHWVSRVRSACLELAPKALKASLKDRGVKCEGCTMREHYLDRLLDSVHLPKLSK